MKHTHVLLVTVIAGIKYSIKDSFVFQLQLCQFDRTLLPSVVHLSASRAERWSTLQRAILCPFLPEASLPINVRVRHILETSSEHGGSRLLRQLASLFRCVRAHAAVNAPSVSASALSDSTSLSLSLSLSL